jgi:hypothetical protein
MRRTLSNSGPKSTSCEGEEHCLQRAAFQAWVNRADQDF